MAPYVDIRLAVFLGVILRILFLFVMVPLLAWTAWALFRFALDLFRAGAGPAGDDPDSAIVVDDVPHGNAPGD